MSKQHGVNGAEFAVVISDQWQNQDLGFELLKQLIEVGRAEKLERITGEILAGNNAMRHICKKLGFKMTTDDDKKTFTAQFIF